MTVAPIGTLSSLYAVRNRLQELTALGAISPGTKSMLMITITLIIITTMQVKDIPTLKLDSKKIGMEIIILANV